MAEILWDKKTGTYDLISSDYLTPEPHAYDIGINIEIEVYQIWYDKGMWGGREGVQPFYYGEMKGQVTSANFSIDSNSDMRSTCSLSIILDENSSFIVHANDVTFWQSCWLKIIKKYNYMNDIDMYPMFNWGDRIGLWNNNGLFRSDPSQFVVGWFVPNNGSFEYNSESREFTMSCIDLMAFLTDSRGGHLTEWSENFQSVSYSLNYFNYGSTTSTYDWSNYPASFGVFDENLYQDKCLVAQNSSGLLLEGAYDLQIQDKQYSNFLSQQNSNEISNDSISSLWREDYLKYQKENDDPNFIIDNKRNLVGVNELLHTLVGNYTRIIPINSIYVNLQNGISPLPYDLDFNGDTTIYDVIKKVTDLYPRQTLYFDSNRRLNIIQNPLAWGEIENTVDFRAREFSGLVLDEHWNIDFSNVKNYVVVWGRDNSCHGYYWITSQKTMCPNCGKVFEDFAEAIDENRQYCPICASNGKGRFEKQKLFSTTETFATLSIGTHKLVVYDDNLITEEECFDAAKAIALQSCHAAKTLSVTLLDRYLSMYQWADKGVGKRIEYKSKLTKETDVYTLLKWSNNLTDGTITMELEPYYTCIDEHVMFKGVKVLPMPEFSISVDKNGLMTMIIHNKNYTEYSLFKIYGKETDGSYSEEQNFRNYHFPLEFWGETCEIYENKNEHGYQTKIYQHQFTHNGQYVVTCGAWNPNIHPSPCPNIKVINIACFEERLIAENGDYLVTEDGDRILHC